jgi:hypothetical protein
LWESADVREKNQGVYYRLTEGEKSKEKFSVYRREPGLKIPVPLNTAVHNGSGVN